MRGFFGAQKTMWLICRGLLFAYFEGTKSAQGALFFLRVSLDAGVKSPDADFFLAAAGPGDIKSRLHPHQRFHLHAESLLDAEAISPERLALLLSRLDRAGRDT